MRSVPWCRIGVIELEGLHGKAELRRMSAAAVDDAGVARWLAERLEAGGLAQVEGVVRRHPTLLAALVEGLDGETPMQVRLGIGALFEELEGTEAARAAVPALARLAAEGDATERADACHYLGFTGGDALEVLRRHTDDPAPDVAEIATESMERLGA